MFIWGQVESFEPKIGVENLVTLSLLRTDHEKGLHFPLTSGLTLYVSLVLKCSKTFEKCFHDIKKFVCILC